MGSFLRDAGSQVEGSEKLSRSPGEGERDAAGAWEGWAPAARVGEEDRELRVVASGSGSPPLTRYLREKKR